MNYDSYKYHYLKRILCSAEIEGNYVETNTKQAVLKSWIDDLVIFIC